MKRFSFLILAVLLVNCGGGGGGGDNSPPPAPPAVDVSGKWVGTYASSVFGIESVEMNLQQSGANVTGNYSSSTGAVGNITGTVSSDIVTFNITVTTPGCSGSYNGIGNVDIPPTGPPTQSFTYSGSSTCGGAENGTGNVSLKVVGPGLVGIDDTSDATAPLLTVTYALPNTPGSTTVQILSNLPSDGDIAYNPVLRSYIPTQGPSSVWFGINSLNASFPEYRAFLTFPLDGITSQPIVPVDALILSADIKVFVNFLDFASAVPTILDLVQYPPAYRGQNGLGSIDPSVDFNAPVLATRQVFDFFSSDAGFFVQIEVTSMMQAAQLFPALLDFQLRFSRDMSVPPLAPSSPARDAGRTVIAPPRSMDGIVPSRQPATARPPSPADLAAQRR